MMHLSFGQTQGLVEDVELQELNALIDQNRVVGVSILDEDGAAVQADGLSEQAVAVFANILDHTRKIGLELGENTRPTLMLSGSGLEVGGLPLMNANALIVRKKSVGLKRDLTHAS